MKVWRGRGGWSSGAALLTHNLGARKGWWSKPHIGHFAPWKDTGPKVKEARKWTSRPIWIDTENPVPARSSKPRSVQPIASCNTDYAIPTAH